MNQLFNKSLIKRLTNRLISRSLPGIVLVLIWGCPYSAIAEMLAANDIYSMDISQLMEMEVVTATRSSVKLKDTLGAVYVITEQQIRERGYRTLVDALQDVPGFDFQNTYGLFPDLVHQRGLVGKNQRSLVYIDGILDNNISESAILGGTIRYPLHNVEQIEIVAGPSSSLYGANAFNGVINVITRDGKKNAGKEIQMFGGGWDKDYTGGGTAFSIRDSAGDRLKPFAYSIGGYYYNSDGPDFRNIQHWTVMEKAAGGRIPIIIQMKTHTISPPNSVSITFGRNSLTGGTFKGMAPSPTAPIRSIPMATGSPAQPGILKTPPSAWAISGKSTPNFPLTVSP